MTDCLRRAFASGSYISKADFSPRGRPLSLCAFFRGTYWRETLDGQVCRNRQSASRMIVLKTLRGCFSSPSPWKLRVSLTVDDPPETICERAGVKEEEKKSTFPGPSLPSRNPVRINQRLLLILQQRQQ